MTHSFLYLLNFCRMGEHTYSSQLSSNVTKKDVTAETSGSWRPLGPGW